VKEINMPTQTAKLTKTNVVDLTAFRARKATPQQQEAPPNEWHVDLALWILDRCAEQPDILPLNDREQEFVQHMTVWPGLPTERQAWWLDKIATRFERALGLPTPPAA
jgi:hypothetical protein